MRATTLASSVVAFLGLVGAAAVGPQETQPAVLSGVAESPSDARSVSAQTAPSGAQDAGDGAGTHGPEAAPRDVRVIRHTLRWAKPSNLVPLLRQLEPHVGRIAVLVPHDHTKTLFVGAESEWTLERVRNWVEELDLPDEGDAPSKTLILPLKETRARVVAEHIARLLTPPKAVRIVPDPYDKRLWVKGPERTIEEVKEIVDCLEEGAAASQSQMTDERRLHFCDVKQADPVSLATSLEQVATMMGLGARLVVDVPSRTLVLYATPEDATKLQEVINRLDVMPKAASQPPLPPVHREEPPP